MNRSTLWKFSISIAIAALLLPLLLAGKVWEDKSFLEWSGDEALKVLTDSPWGQPLIFREIASASGPGAIAPNTRPSEGSRTFPTQAPSGSTEVRTRTTAVYGIGFLSAKPLRMALARLAMLNGGLDEAQARQFAEQDPFPGQIAVSVTAPGNQRDSIMMTLSTADLQDSTYLELKKSKRKLPLERYLKPGEAGNDQAVFFFARSENGKEMLTASEDEVKFYTRISPDLVLEKKFKLKKMVFEGRLEI